MTVKLFTLDFLLIPKFSMMSLVSAIEPLRVANRVLGAEAYKWRFVSQNGDSVVASNGMTVDSVDFAVSEKTADVVLVNASYDPDRVVMPQTFAWLRRAERHGATIGSMDTGAFFLAKAGLIDHVQATVHWEAIAWFNAKFPDINFVPQIYVAENQRMTCAGGTSSLDMILHLIREHQGSEISSEVASQLISPGIRENSERQKHSSLKGLSYAHPKLSAACALVDENMSKPFTAEQLATRVGMPRRSLDALFRKHLGLSTARYILQARLNETRRLIRVSALRIEEIAYTCGFVSTAHFTRVYRKQFFVSPASERK